MLIPNVTALEGVTLDVHDSASVDLAQLTSIENSTVNLYSRTNDFPALTSFLGSYLYAYDSWLELTNFTVLYATNSHLQFRADQGGVIDLSNVTNVVMNSSYGFYVNAYSGGHVNLSRMQVPEGQVYVEASQADSLVDLSGFRGLWDGYGSVGAGDGARVAISNVTAMRNIQLNLSGEAIVPTAQLRSFTEGLLQLSLRTNLFTDLTNFTGALSCSYLAHATFPSLTQLDATNYAISVRADYDSVIDLSQVTNAVVDFGHALSLYAYGGGRIELPLLESIVAGNVYVQANGAGAIVDLSGLTGFFSDNNGGSLYTVNGGTILLNPNAMLLAGVAIDFQSNPGGPLPPFLAPSQSLVLYGQPWQSYRIESRDPSVAGSPWLLYKRVPLTEPLELIGSRPPKGLALRVYAFVADPPEVDLRVPSAGVVENILFGVPERTYRLESTASLGTPIVWENGPATTLTNSFFIFPSAGTTNNARFYRAREL